mmetsp:Transcript_48368/g.119844  ORF Transcript_48368/g.119844 Transcript_48368/m.119844 type:complete len:241 (+) Transcript_48368:1906-2628(+)
MEGITEVGENDEEIVHAQAERQEWQGLNHSVVEAYEQCEDAVCREVGEDDQEVSNGRWYHEIVRERRRGMDQHRKGKHHREAYCEDERLCGSDFRVHPISRVARVVCERDAREVHLVLFNDLSYSTDLEQECVGCRLVLLRGHVLKGFTPLHDLRRNVEEELQVERLHRGEDTLLSVVLHVAVKLAQGFRGSHQPMLRLVAQPLNDFVVGKVSVPRKLCRVVELIWQTQSSGNLTNRRQT